MINRQGLFNADRILEAWLWNLIFLVDFFSWHREFVYYGGQQPRVEE